MFRLALLWLGLLLILSSPGQSQEIRIGSKSFTENVIIAEIMSQAWKQLSPESQVVHRSQLGGTRILWEALKSGEIDMYPEYSGTLQAEIFRSTGAALSAQLLPHQLSLSQPLGFNNTYALGLPQKRAQQLGLSKISQLKQHPGLRFGLGNEFLNRQDGWPSLSAKYQLQPKWVRGFDHDLAYRALASGSIDLTDTYSTDADIDAYQLVLLEDDLKHFPRYDCLIVYRASLKDHPTMLALLQKLEGQFSDASVRQLNRKVRLEGQSEIEVARNWLSLDPSGSTPSALQRLTGTTLQHLQLVGLSLTFSLVIGLPIGVLAHVYPHWGRNLVAASGMVQTIPSLALLVFLIPLTGLGSLTAILALTLYGLLPIVLGTFNGLESISPALRESAVALGLTPTFRWRKVYIPLALPSLISGIQTTTVTTIGTATLAALIGAGGYGEPILTGVRLARNDLLLEGALPAALMALLAQLFLHRLYLRSLPP